MEEMKSIRVKAMKAFTRFFKKAGNRKSRVDALRSFLGALSI
jgi:hypothetical protein